MSHRHPPAPNLHPAPSPQPPAPARRGLTLIEMLVALAVTLVMMAAVVNLFANISGSIRNRRAMIEVGGQIRQVRQRLALDLEGATCAAKTWQLPSENRGYIEIIEGQFSDMHPSVLLDGDPGDGEIDYATSQIPSGGDVTTDLTLTNPPLTARQPQPGDVTNGRALGDHDDMLALTVRSEAEPFKAQVPIPGGNDQLVESTLAEVLWFAVENPIDDPGTPNVDESNGAPGMRTIYRRVLLIVPSLGPWNSGSNDPPANISARFVPASGGTPDRWVANTLGDLTKRENRVERRFGTPQEPFPFPMSGMGSSTTTERIVLSNALAFDLRVFDPGAPLYEASSGTVVQPGDPGWIAEATKATPTLVGFGAYCDLGWAWDTVGAALVYNPALPLPTGVPAPVFNTLRQVGWHPMLTNADVALRDYPCVYDTWSFHYENNGMEEEDLLVQFATDSSITPLPQFDPWQLDTVDQGTNGLDDDNLNGVDDVGERETSPPYDTPLRGVKVILRIYETDARQIRETSVTHSFAE